MIDKRGSIRPSKIVKEKTDMLISQIHIKTGIRHTHTTYIEEANKLMEEKYGIVPHGTSKKSK